MLSWLLLNDVLTNCNDLTDRRPLEGISTIVDDFHVRPNIVHQLPAKSDCVNDDESNELANWIFLALDDQSISMNDLEFPSEPYQTLSKLESLGLSFRRQFRIAWSIDSERLHCCRKKLESYRENQIRLFVVICISF